MIEITNKVPIYEVGGEQVEAEAGDKVQLLVKSHHIHSDRVILVCDGEEIVVIARDLEAAIQNATNNK